MDTISIACIWLGYFDSHRQLMEYVEWEYVEQENLPKCAFSEDTGLGYFDSDFMESLFATDQDELLQKINALSFVENFKDQLMERISKDQLKGMNSVISLTGIKGPGNDVNEKLFDFSFPEINYDMLKFIGTFLYKV